MQLHISGIPYSQHAINVIRTFATHGYHLAYSGGKDSDTVLQLTKAAGVKFTAWYNFCPLDPPEVRHHIRTMSLDPANHLHYAMPTTSLIAEARKRKIMPLRNRRWCCEVIKERPSPNGLPILTGIRWAESPRRKKRQQVEACHRVKTFFVHPIIDWSTADVWAYLNENNHPRCSLYADGFTRVGCVLCPMTRDVDRQLARWPQIANIWKRINAETYNIHGFHHFPSEKAQWDWWIDRDAHAPAPDDCPLFESLDND